MKKKETKVLCPACGTEFKTPDEQYTTIATVIGKNSGLGIVYPVIENKQVQIMQSKSVQERIEALRASGVDVSNLFAMKGANGGEFIASNKNGILTVLDENDPLFSFITSQGTVPNRQLFRRFVMAQMFRMMTYIPYGKKEPLGVTKMIYRLGYEYQWKMLLNELYAQMKMEGKDTTNFTDRNRWFHVETVRAMADDYIEKLKKRIAELPVKHCKGIPYIRINSRDIFVSDIYNKLYKPLYKAMRRISQTKNAAQLYSAAKSFNDMRIKMPSDTPQCKTWVDAYKGSGAFFTMQNLIRFHNCVAINDSGKILDKYQSLKFITKKADLYKNGEGWCLLGVLKKMLEDNDINVSKKVAEWRKRK